MIIKPDLLPHQYDFAEDYLTPYILLLGGYGCVSGSTKVWTEGGLVRIDDIKGPTRVLSWNETNQKFQLSLSGGAFPRGRAKLHQVSTQQGEFVAAARHLVFSSDNTYRNVGGLSSADEIVCCKTWCINIPFFSCWLMSFLDVQNYSKRDEDYLRSYADAARQYGRRFLAGQGYGQGVAPSITCVRKSHHNYGQAVFESEGDSEELTLGHNRLGLFFYLKQTRGLVRLFSHLLAALVVSMLTWFSVRIFGSPLVLAQSHANTSDRHTMELFSPVLLFFFRALKSWSHPFVNTKSIAVSVEEDKSPYYDMQVLGTNNYICENGFIHHNCGKTHGFAAKAIVMAILNAGYVGTIMEPTGPLLQDILVPSLEEVLELMGFNYTPVKTDRPPAYHYSTKTNNQKPNYYLNCGAGKVTELRLRSAENWRRQIGSNQAFVGVDEIDTLKPDDALKMMQKSKPRIRKGNRLQFFASTTPEEFGFCYRFFEKGKDEKHRTIRAKTEDNPHLPDNYIPDLMELYPENLIRAYLNGEYVNLRSGTVYCNFSRRRNSTTVTLDHTAEGEYIGHQEPLHIGMDFNVTKMAAVVHVFREGKIYAVKELVKMYDTPAAIKTIKELYPNRDITIYPDATGKNRETVDASQSDLSLLRDAGFRVVADLTNPAVKDRINSMNAAFLNGKNQVRYYVNVEECPNYTDSLDQQPYDDNGQPDKRHDLDHLPDGAGYMVCKVLPVRANMRPMTRRA